MKAAKNIKSKTEIPVSRAYFVYKNNLELITTYLFAERIQTQILHEPYHFSMDTWPTMAWYKAWTLARDSVQFAEFN